MRRKSRQAHRPVRTWVRWIINRRGLFFRNAPRAYALAALALLIFISGLAIFLFRPTEAAVGDMAIYREATAGELIGTTLTNTTWDTTITQGAIYTLDGGNASVNLGETGHYLVVYNLGIENFNGNNRSEIQGLIDVSGTNIAYGRSSCFIRRSTGQDECFMAGAAIIEAVSGDDVLIEAQRTDSNTATVRRRANTNGFSILKLDDALPYARIQEAGGGQAFNSATFSTVDFDTNDELDTGFSRSGGDITLAAPGRYLVTSNVMFRTTVTNQQRSNTTRLTLDGTEIPGTRISAYMAGSDSSQDHAATWIGIIETTASNQVLRLQANCSSETCGNTTNVGGETGLTIVRLPATAETIRLIEAGGGQAVDGTNDPILWDTEVRVDAASFGHSTTTNTSRVTVQEDGDYLFLGSFYANRSAPTTANLYPHWEWRENGTTEFAYGSFGKYNNGDSGSAGSYEGGASGALLTEGLSAGDYVELLNTDETTSSDASATFQAHQMSVSAVRIETLRISDVTISTLGSQTTSVNVPATDEYMGGAFRIVANRESETLEDITITETGTVDAATNLDNIKIFYDLDTSAPYDCASESYAGTETQFGSTDTDGFSASNGSSTFSGSVTINTTQTMCAYVVLDVGSAGDGETIEIEISNPSTDAVVDSGDVSPESVVAVSGTTSILDDRSIQTHYHWRNDDGDEAGASSATSGVEDTPVFGVEDEGVHRLRISVSNEGSTATPAQAFRLEYAVRSGACSSSGPWTDVGSVGGHWDMAASGLTDAGDTTDILVASGGVTNENTTFLTPNGGQRESTSQTGSLTLGSSNFVELEYAIAANVDAIEGSTYCFRLTDAGTPLKQYDVFPEATIKSDVFVSSLGSQEADLTASTSDNYIGGTFVITEQASSRSVTDITITETGTVDAALNLDNIKLFYDLDTTAPYDCASESYAGTETQFGSTDTDGFSSANGSSTFSGSVTINTTQTMCGYVVLDVLASAGDGETIEIEISRPSFDIGISAGTVNPNEAVALSGTTDILSPRLEFMHYHWRNDDGDEDGASSKSGGIEDTAVSGLPLTETIRLRVEISNEGSADSATSSFRLEYAERETTCANIGAWTQVGTGAWVMSDTANLTNGSDTTDIATTTGGVTNENTTLLTPNGGVLDQQSESDEVIVPAANFIELEYSIEPTDTAEFGTTYCFRISDGGDELPVYSVYPEAATRLNRDFSVQRGVSTIAAGQTTASITAGADYTVPGSDTAAFIRITNTHSTGAGHDNGGGIQQADDVTAYVSNPGNIESGVTFTRTGNTGTTRIAWEIVEYTGPEGGDNEFIVREAGTHAMNAANTTETLSVAGVSDDSKVVVFATGLGNDDPDIDEYHTSLVTTEWDGANDEIIFARGATGAGGGNVATISYAVVEFTGANWLVQRVEHTYSLAGGTESITPVNSISRAFIHSQKRAGEGRVDAYGHEVWLSSVGVVSFQLQSTTATPSSHTSVAWIIENTQTTGTPMNVTRTNGTQSGGPEPSAVSVQIGTTLADENAASIFISSRSSGIDNSYPAPMISARITSSTTYEIWVSDTALTRTYRTEVVEWPTAIKLVTQNYYRFYADNDSLDPADAWPPGASDVGENTAITASDDPPVPGTVIRIRMSLNVTGSNISASTKQYKLQVGERSTTCTAIADWQDVADTSSTTAVWRGYNATPEDGSALSTDPPDAGDLNLSVSDKAGTYEENNPTALNPFKLSIGDDIEYDWVLLNQDAPDFTAYCFRMVEEDGSALDGYDFYPTITTGGFVLRSRSWKWFDDEASLTPTVALAATNTAPSNVAVGSALKLRIALEEVAGKGGPDTKFKLQFSESSDFATAIDVIDMDSCDEDALWCYYDGAGTEHATITEAVLADTDACAGAEGAGCGTHNEYSFVPQVFGEVGTVSVDSSGTTVNLQNTYDNPVIIAESITGDDTGGAGDPAAAIITATTSTSFSVRIIEPSGEGDDHGSETLSYIVMEAGAHTLPNGTRIDAGLRPTSHYYGIDAGTTGGDTCAFTQTFAGTPVVVSALQSDNTGSFVTVSQHSIDSDGFSCAVEVPDGSAGAPSSETIGWIAIDPGVHENNGLGIEATTTSESVTGWSDTPWYEQAFTQVFPGAPLIVASKQTRNGPEGGWVRYDSLAQNSIRLSIDSGDGGDGRSHEEEVVGYIAFSEAGDLIKAGDATYDFPAATTAEFEFTVLAQKPKVNTAYFFRLYDSTRDQAVVATSSDVYPSIQIEGSALTFTVSGIDEDTATENITTSIGTSPSAIPFGRLPVGTLVNGAHRLTVSTNATEGYHVFVYERQDLLSSVGQILDVSATNASPAAWADGCNGAMQSCYGYHTGDNTLSGGSTRFLIDDTYAALTSSLEEVAYSSGPAEDETTDIVYRVMVTNEQPAGEYESELVYIVVPVF
jgi:hypothetical protein